MAIRVVPHVEIAAVVGGYMVKTLEWKPERGEYDTEYRIAISIDEVVAHVRRSLEAVDAWGQSAYDQVGKK